MGPKYSGNAVTNADTPYLHSLTDGKTHPMTTLKTYGDAVGLPEFQTGGSEAGHITIGAGRAVKLLLTKINDTIDDGSFMKNEKLVKLFEKAKKRNRIVFMGLTSDGGVHSFQPHLYGLLQMAKKYGIENVYNHCFLDGRDVGMRTAKGYLKELEENGGKISSIGGRFYHLDRDTNWDRTQKSYAVLTESDCETESRSWEEVLDTHYDSTDESDYYLPPVLFDKDAQIQPDDVVIGWNFRTDRMRQITAALCDEDFPHFETSTKLDPKNYGIFGPYYDAAQQPFAFDDEVIKNTLGEWVSAHGGTQLRMSETEKYPHVTFFFSGQRKTEFEGEERVLVASPKVPIYSEKPEMSARELTEKALENLDKDYNLIVHNYPNPDLVGHSGVYEAAVEAAEVLEECTQKLIPSVLEAGYDLILIADHGNSDIMINPDGTGNASHTKANAPFVLISNNPKLKTVKLRDKGTLGDIAPTIIDMLGLDVPEEMTGSSLINDV